MNTINVPDMKESNLAELLNMRFHGQGIVKDYTKIASSNRRLNDEISNLHLFGLNFSLIVSRGDNKSSPLVQGYQRQVTRKR